VARWLAIASLTIVGAVVAAGLGLAAYMGWLFYSLPDAREIAEYRPPTSTRVFAYDGTLIGEFAEERRIFVPYDQIPEVLIRAFLAAEDRTFFQHSGIDFVGFSRAMLNNVGNYVQGRRLEGGSTITQQVAKNVLLTSDVTVGRKLKEAVLARRLEETLDKEQILELYMNEVYLGYRSYGVGAAAFNYFGKPLNQLTIEEAAYIAAVLKGPENYHPKRRKRQAMARRNWIIGEMDELGWITPQQAKVALATDLNVQDAPARARYRDADYFVEEVRLRAKALKSVGDQVGEGGYYIRTTLDPEMQTAGRIALMNGVEAYDRRHGWRGAKVNIPLGAPWEKEARAMRRPAERPGWERARVESVDGASVRVQLFDGGGGLLAAEDVKWAQAGKGLLPGDLVFVEKRAEGGLNLRQLPEVNGAFVAIDPWSGRVLAMVGGYSFSLQNFNRAVQAERQPGSAFKPFVYATALENGFTPASRVLDAPVTFRGANGQAWTPENYSRRSYGWQSLRNGLVYSRNQMTVRLANQIGMKKVRENAIDFGVVDDMLPVLSMALGSGETTPLKLTAAYSPFVNGGRTVSPHLIEVVHDRDGKAVYTAEERDCPRARCDTGFTDQGSPRFPLTGKQVIHPVTAYQVTSMLEGVVQQGTAVKALVLNRPIAGKTGTTNEYRSAWFVGYTPDLIAGVFIGFDDNRSLGNGETGGAAALPVFIEFMQRALEKTPPKPFLPPDAAEMLIVGGQPEAFRRGTEPGAPRTIRTSDGSVVAAPRVARPRPQRPAADKAGGSAPYRAGPSATPAPQPEPAPPPKPKQVPQDLSGLY
jgi:penicillin-binding protein 1A